ncbi:MAG: phosphodiester glycosidase family protein [Bacteroidota bacterium]|nr:phosphodiester glycosidase family protein [Bacteroidota bacterium]
MKKSKKLVLRIPKRVFNALILLIFLSACGSSHLFSQPQSERLISLTNIHTDTLFNSRQAIHLFTIPDTSLKKLKIEFVYNGTQLLKTSYVAERHHALAAVNGSFFDMDSGGSVCYFEINDSVVSRTKSHGKWAIPDSLANGAVVMTKNSQLEIQPAQTEKFYEESKQENAVLISGPLLIRNAQAMKLPDMPFSKKRYPRTFLCRTRDAVLFIAVDGKSESAEGMSLYEAQHYLQNLGCVDAINLDGGGSTTMWMKGRGIVNHPSDKTGERKVAGEILILEK